MFKKILLATAVLASTAAVAQTVVSWNNVNETLAEVTTKIKVSAPYLNQFEINFDPASNLATDNVKMNLVAGTDQAVWEGGAAVLTTSLDLNAKAPVDEKREVAGSLMMSLATKVVPALQHLFKDYIDQCAIPEPISGGYNDISNGVSCGFMTKLGAASSVSDLRVAAVAAYSDYVSLVGAYKVEKEALLANETNPDTREELEYEIERAQKDLADIALLKVTGSGDELKVRFEYTWMATDAVTFSFDIVTKSDVTSGSIGLNTMIPEADYQAYKNALVDYLTEIEGKTPDALEMIEGMATAYAQLIGEFITK